MDYLAWMPQGLSTDTIVLLAVILGSSALMSGLSGFGFSAIGAICLWVLPPVQAIPLLMALSTFNQLTSIRQLTADMLPLRQWWPNGPAPYLLGGLIGVPIGLSILYALPTSALMATFGGFLLLYAIYSLLMPIKPCMRCQGWFIPMLVGAAGGIIGGFTAFPGAAVVVWTSMCGMPKGQSRAIVQPYILILQIASLAMLATQHPATFGTEFWKLLVLMLPVVLPFTLLGVFLYKSLSEFSFRRIAFMLLGVSGGGIFYKGVSNLTVVAALVGPAPSTTGVTVAQAENASKLITLCGTETPRSSKRCVQTRQAIKNACDMSGSSLIGMGRGPSKPVQRTEAAPAPQTPQAEQPVVVLAAVSTALSCVPHWPSSDADQGCSNPNNACTEREEITGSTTSARKKVGAKRYKTSRYYRRLMKRRRLQQNGAPLPEENCELFGPTQASNKP